MRCHAAEWGAVTGRFGPHKPGADRRTGGPVGFPKEAATAVKAWLHGPDGRAGLKIRLDQGVTLHTSSGPEEWPGDEIKHRGGAPVGVRPTSLGAHASPGVLFKCDADRRSTPSPVWEKGKRDQRCAPASVNGPAELCRIHAQHRFLYFPCINRRNSRARERNPDAAQHVLRPG